MKDNILKKIETPYVDAQTLLNLLTDYKKPREAISRFVKNGELIRLKNGFYLIADKMAFGSKTIVPHELIANMLYGPSYVSLEWALSFYGMIPEGVVTVTSMALGRDKEFHTPVGDFTYNRLSSESYYKGITQKNSPDFIGNFLIATPEKALADLVFKTCKGMKKEELKVELLESRRIDPESLAKLDRQMLADIAASSSSRSVKSLVDLVGML